MKRINIDTILMYAGLASALAFPTLCAVETYLRSLGR